MPNTLYCLGKRRRRRRLRPKLLLLFLLIAVMATALLIHTEFSPMVLALAESDIRNTVSNTVHSIVYEAVSEEPEMFSALVEILYKEDGTVSALNIPTLKLNYIRTQLAKQVIRAIASHETMEMQIPLGNVLGISFLSGMGPELSVRAILTRSFHADFTNEFIKTGINQTLYRVLFTINLRVRLLLPGRISEFDITHTFPMSETVIVGPVPDAYTEIHRLTDDITETEIDDIYDFGASSG